jgi:hypothetical protein
MAEMTLAARRPLNWNVLTVDAKGPSGTGRSWRRAARRRGGKASR